MKNNKNNGYRMFTKGALEEVLKTCTKVKYDGKIVEITDEMINIVEEKASSYNFYMKYDKQIENIERAH